MSQTTVLNTGQQAIINTDVSKIFLWGNRYLDADYTNPDGDYAVTIPAGTVMGRIASTNKIIPLESGASDGSQFPVGILAQDYTVDAGADQTMSICIAGDVAEEQVDLQGTDTLDTTVSDRTIRDRIMADTHGIKLVPGTEMTAYDNS